MSLRNSELWSAIDRGAITAEVSGTADLTLEGNRTFGDFSGLGLDFILQGTPDAPATGCLDVRDTTFIVWDPEDGNVARFAAQANDALRLAGYSGSTMGEAFGGTASEDILDWLIGRRSAPLTFNDALEFNIAANTLSSVLAADGCASPLTRQMTPE